jgi:F0F1-type ATP synthase delta subunit
VTELAREYGDGLYALCAEENLSADMLSELQELKKCLREEPDFFRLLSGVPISCSVSSASGNGFISRTSSSPFLADSFQ